MVPSNASLGFLLREFSVVYLESDAVLFSEVTNRWESMLQIDKLFGDFLSCVPGYEGMQI